MRKKMSILLGLGLAISLMASVFTVAPVAASSALDTTVNSLTLSAAASALTAGEKRAPVVYPWAGKRANHAPYWNAFFGKGWSCEKITKSGGFKLVNSKDAISVKVKDPVTGVVTSKVLRNVEPGWYGAPHYAGALHRFHCRNLTPSPAKVVINPYGYVPGPCEVGKHRLVILNDRGSNRPATIDWKYTHKSKGPKTATQKLLPGQKWFTNWRPLRSGTRTKATVRQTGEVLFNTPVVSGTGRSCWSGVKPGVRY